MRFHTNHHTTATVEDALRREKDAGRIAPHVSFKTLSTHGSRTHVRALEIQLEAAERDNGRRAGNSGSYGAMRPEYDGFAATYDEWGWLIAALYRAEPDMVSGTPKTPQYRNKAHFDHRTALTYNPWDLVLMLDTAYDSDPYTCSSCWGIINRDGADMVPEDGEVCEGHDPYPIVTGRAASSKLGFMIGRRGADRVAEQPSYWPGRVLPRTVAEVLEYSHLTREDIRQAVSA